MPACGSLVGYFPSKRAFFAAIVEEEGAKLLRASTPDLSRPPFDQIKAGLEVWRRRSASSRSRSSAAELRVGPIRLGVLARLCGELLKFLDERFPCVDQLAGVVEVPEVDGPQCRLFGDTFERLGVGVVVNDAHVINQTACAAFIERVVD